MLHKKLNMIYIFICWGHIRCFSTMNLDTQHNSFGQIQEYIFNLVVWAFLNMIFFFSEFGKLCVWLGFNSHYHCFLVFFYIFFYVEMVWVGM